MRKLRMSRDPMFCCCIMYPTDYELETGTGDIDLGEFSEDSFQGFAMRAAKVVRRNRPVKEIADDLASCGFNAALLVGFCGSNFRPDDIRSKRFVELTRKFKKRGIAVGVCISFADTVDNYLTRNDPKMHQLRYDGKRTYIRFDPNLEKTPYLLYNIDYGCEKFVKFAREIVLAAKDAGMDFIDYAEPDYWPTENNGYGKYLEEAYRKKYDKPPPYPSNSNHRMFMEDYHLESMKHISEFAHGHGILDHMTASPMGHATYHICQNYGKYSTTSISELSSTYHYGFGLHWKNRIKQLYGVDYGGHRFSSIGCLEVRYMRGWEERHATYLVPGQSLPAETYANAVDQQMFLHNMDLVFWEYPSIKKNYYETTEPWINGREAWAALRKMFKSKVEKYMSLPADYHRAIPVPEALVYYSKRGVYASPKTDKTTPCAYATVLKLQAENIPVGFLYPEYMEPLAGRKYDANMLLIDEHHPVSKGGWRDIRKWLAKGGRVVIYGGKPGCDWDTAAEQKKFPKEMEQLFGVKLAKCGRHFRKIDPSPIDKPLPSVMSGLDVTPMGNATVLKLAGGKPFVTINETGRKSLAVYVAAPICELPVAFLSRLCTWLLKQVGKKIVSVNTPLEVEVCLYKNEGKFYVAAKNHSCEKRRAEFGIKTGWRPRKITELMHEAPVKGYRFSKGKTVFSDVPDANSVRIYEITL